MSSLTAEQDLRRQLEEYEIPAHLLQPQPPSALDSNRIHEYKQARDTYLQRKFQHEILKHALTFDGTQFSALSELQKDANSPEEWAELREKQDSVQAALTEKAAAYQRALLELRAKHDNFQARRAELQDMLDHPDSSYFGGEDEDEEEIDEEALAAQEERLNELQKRRAALEVELRSVQQSHDQKVQAVAERQAEYDALVQKENNNSLGSTIALDDPVALEKCQTENEELRAKMEKMAEIKNFYEKLRLLLEELVGVRVQAVEASPEGAKTMVVKAQLLQLYDVEIVLRVEGRQHKLTVVSAKIVSDNTVISGPATLDEETGEPGNIPVVQLQIPPLNDLVAAASDSFQSNVSGEPLRFLLREIKARIQATQQRVHELTLLQKEALTKIGRYNVGTQSNDQEVVCSLNYAQMTAVLRLTPDCPLVAGSVFLDQLVGLGGWDTQVVERIKTTVSEAASYQSPVAIVRAIKAEIQRLQDEENLVLPETPRMPVRGHVW